MDDGEGLPPFTCNALSGDFRFEAGGNPQAVARLVSAIQALDENPTHAVAVVMRDLSYQAFKETTWRECRDQGQSYGYLFEKITGKSLHDESISKRDRKRIQDRLCKWRGKYNEELRKQKPPLKLITYAPRREQENGEETYEPEEDGGYKHLRIVPVDYKHEGRPA